MLLSVLYAINRVKIMYIIIMPNDMSYRKKIFAYWELQESRGFHSGVVVGSDFLGYNVV